MRTPKRKAFTLIELLTVIAITGILLTLIIVPVIQSFNLTRAAQGWSEAQDRARIVLERVSREVTNAAGVRDNSGLAGAVVVEVPGRPANLGGSGGIVRVTMPYAKLDIVKPAEGEPEVRDGAFVDPYTGRADPTAVAPRGQVVLPVAPGTTYVRYFIGLANPFRNYTNPYDAYGGWLVRSGVRDNMYVLWRIEFQPIVYDPGNQSFRTNTELFVDANADGRPDDIDDPLFFVPNRDGAGNIITNDAKAQRIQHWLNRGTIVTEISRFDMIRPIYDKRTRVPAWDTPTNPNAPRLLALVQFKPTRMTSESAEGMVAIRQGEESENMESVAPDVYRTRFGDWSSLLVRTWPTGFDPAADPDLDKYLVGRRSGDDFSIFVYDPDSGSEAVTGAEVFNISAYERLTRANAAYPYTGALVLAGLANGVNRDLFVPYFTQPRTGKLIASFGIDEHGFGALPPFAAADTRSYLGRNVPSLEAGVALAPSADDTSGGTFSDTQYSSINRKFNRIWNVEGAALRPNLHRFIDLRVTPSADGTLGPLHPDKANVGFMRAHIVPGSEVVYGPDQRPGPNYGTIMRYTRTTREPGPNQYRINYVDLVPPTDWNLLGVPPPPANYDPTNFTSAVIEPRYKAGYLQLHSDPNAPVPDQARFVDANQNSLVGQGRVFVRYRFGFTKPKDVFAVDYDSRQVLSVLLTILNYPQSNLPNPQSITLKATATVRNFLR